MLVVRLIVGLAIEAVIVGIALAVRAWSHDGWVALSAFLALTALYLLDSFQTIPAQPPHKGVLKFLGRRLHVTLNEGLQFLPLYPLFNVILVNVTKVNQDLNRVVKPGDEKDPELWAQRLLDVRTPDLAELTVAVSFTWTPDDQNLIPYLNAGGEAGVKNIFEDMARTRLREWMIAEDWPNTWQEAIRAHDGAVKILIENIAGVEADDRLMARMRTGNGVVSLPSLGITLNRVNVGEIKPIGELAAAAERKVKETQDREGDRIKAEFIRDQVRELAKPIEEGGAGLTPAESRRTIQVAQGDVSEAVDTKVFGLTSETSDLVAGVIQGIFGGQPPQAPRPRRPRRRTRRPRGGSGGG